MDNLPKAPQVGDDIASFKFSWSGPKPMPITTTSYCLLVLIMGEDRSPQRRFCGSGGKDRHMLEGKCLLDTAQLQMSWPERTGAEALRSQGEIREESMNKLEQNPSGGLAVLLWF